MRSLPFMRILLLVALGIVLAFTFESLGLPTYVTIGAIFLVFMIISVSWPFYIIYKTNNLKLVDRYMKNNAKRPIFNYSYQLAHGTDEEVINALHTMLERFPQPEMQMVYKGNLAIFEKDADALQAHAESLSPSEYRVYFLLIAHAMRGEFAEARQYEAKLTSPWTRFSAASLIAHYEGDEATAEQQFQQLMNVTHGMQKYTLYHSFQRLNA